MKKISDYSPLTQSVFWVIAGYSVVFLNAPYAIVSATVLGTIFACATSTSTLKNHPYAYSIIITTWGLIMGVLFMGYVDSGITLYQGLISLK